MKQGHFGLSLIIFIFLIQKSGLTRHNGERGLKGGFALKNLNCFCEVLKYGSFSQLAFQSEPFLQLSHMIFLIN
jgi:hypothetical protein